MKLFYFKKNLLRLIFSIVLILFQNKISFSSNQDSLLKKFNNLKLTDSVRFEALYKHASQIGKNNSDSAIKIGYVALNFAKKTGLKFLEAKSYRLIGKFNADSALFYNIKSLKLLEGTNDFLGLASTYNNIAGVYSSINEFDKALNFRYKSIEFAEKSGDKNILAICYINIGGLLMRTDDDKSFHYKFKAIKLYEELKDTNSLILSYSMLGNTYYNIPDSIEKAGYYYNKALQMAKKRNQYQDIAGNYCMMGGYYLNKGNYKIALLYLDSSNQINKSKNNNDYWIKLTILKNQESAFFNLKQYDNAYIVRLEADSIEDKFFDENKKKDNRELLEKFENEKKIIENEKNKIKQLEEKKRQNLIIISTIFLLFVVITFTIIVFRRYKIIKNQKIIIENKEKETQEQNSLIKAQKHLVEEKQKEILDSIHYAKRLQKAILPPLKFIDEHVPNNFVLYQPKDVVAGDFYWAEMKDDKFFIAAADCTGHGVPGAMVSVVCSNALNRTVNEFGITNTGNILDKTRELVLETFAKGNSEVKDGMDISLLCIDKKNNKAFWSGANNPLWYVDPVTLGTQPSVTSSEVEKSTVIGIDSARPNIKEIKADKQPIGKTDNPKPFTTHEIELKPGIQFYLFTDGYADQFGGPKGKKFKYKQLEDLLLDNANKNMQEQHQTLITKFSEWKGDLEQVDDVCVIGVRL